jgi:hypothetical protein
MGMTTDKKYTIIDGACHCGNITYEFKTVFTAESLIIRNCQCSFCKVHGGATARDPDGTVKINARDSDLVTLYRFGTKTTDFVLCARCGVYVGAVLTHKGKQTATLNMRLSSLDTSNAEPIVYDDEPAEDRVARRMELFTPVIECPF